MRYYDQDPKWMERGRKHKAFIVFICCLLEDAVNSSGQGGLMSAGGMISEM
jgi:hypothetical protein